MCPLRSPACQTFSSSNLAKDTWVEVSSIPCPGPITRLQVLKTVAEANVRVSGLIAVSGPKTDSLRHHRVAAYSTRSLRLTASVSCLQPLHIVANTCLFNPPLFYFLKYLISMTGQFFASDFAVGIVCVGVCARARVCGCMGMHTCR